ncbi:MAG: hypothetical protein ABL874_09140, partial [Sphingopyxis sp.]
MTIDGREVAGIGAAVAAHIILFALLSFQLTRSQPPQLDNPPMAVEIIAEAAPVATAPAISQAPPAARLGDPDSDEAEVPPPPRPTPAPPKPPKPQVREPVRAPRAVPTAPPRRTAPPQAERTPARTTPPRPAARPVRDPR